jgi:hypothetical protein
MHYSLSAPLVVLAYGDNHHAAVTIPAGKTIEVMGLAEDDRFLVINFEGERLLVFERDLEEQGMPVDWNSWNQKIRRT